MARHEFGSWDTEEVRHSRPRLPNHGSREQSREDYYRRPSRVEKWRNTHSVLSGRAKSPVRPADTPIATS